MLDQSMKDDLNVEEVSQEETIDIAQLEDMTVKAKIVGTRSWGKLHLLFFGRDGEALFSMICHYCPIPDSEAVRAVEFSIQAATPKDLARAIYAAFEVYCQSYKARAEEDLDR